MAVDCILGGPRTALVLKVDVNVDTVTGLVDAIANLDVNGIFCGGANGGREHDEGSSETHDEQLG